MSDADLEAALSVMTKNSPFSELSPKYVALFKAEWRKRDPEQTGKLPIDDVVQMTTTFVANGWEDWRLGAGELAVLDEIAEIFEGRVPIAEFALWAEDSEYHPDIPGRMAMPRSKMEAGQMLMANFEARAKSFDPKTFSKETAKSSVRSANHCVDCENQPMMQHIYTSCPQCCGNALDYMTVCGKCAANIGRCCACTKKLL